LVSSWDKWVAVGGRLPTDGGKLPQLMEHF